jgi:hypothetical protein
MIMSVSTLTIGRGAAMPVRVVNFSMAANPVDCSGNDFRPDLHKPRDEIKGADVKSR